jgi:membrane-bound lytic murein transglycosylase B
MARFPVCADVPLVERVAASISALGVPVCLLLLLLMGCASTAPPPPPQAAAPQPALLPAATVSAEPTGPGPAPGLPAGTAPNAEAGPPEPSAAAEADPPTPPPEPLRAASYEDLAAVRAGGWLYLFEKLVADGVSPDRVATAFADPRMPSFDGLFFGLEPRESHAMYRHFRSARSIAQAEACAAAHADELVAAERGQGVDASVLAAIMHVETHCGRNTGRSMVLYRLARLAMANEPRNVARNLARHGDAGDVDPELGEQIRERARYLEGVFYPQVLATFEIARRQHIDPLSIRGSGAGAFGFVQFLPANYVAFGTDGNGDGRVSLYDPSDATASCARFLASYGWRPGISRRMKRAVIWHYNRSEAYIDTVLMLAARIEASGVLASSRAAAAEASVLPAAAMGANAATASP